MINKQNNFLQIQNLVFNNLINHRFPLHKNNLRSKKIFKAICHFYFIIKELLSIPKVVQGSEKVVIGWREVGGGGGTERISQLGLSSFCLNQKDHT